ncbi:MAG: sugar phosphate isomerase/epimerase [Clostridia bacterium]|nr:sugar phosphate isomerase/epimerase [Clostridia bacterium]
MAKFLISAFADEACDALEGQIKALHRNGLHCIEPRSMSGNVIKKNDEELYAIRAQLDAAGITVPSLGSPIGKFEITEDFDLHLAEFERALRACEILGTKRMRIFSFFVKQDQLAQYRDEVMRRMTVLLERADKAGVTLCHENESHIYGQNPAEVKDLLDTLPGLRGIFDAANYVRHDQDPIKGFEATADKLEYIHVKDALFSDHSMIAAGEGNGQYKEILSRVDRMTDRTIVLTVEPHLYLFDAYKKIDKLELKHNRVFNTSDDAFDYAVSALKKLLAEIGHPIVNGEG